jgi:signal transduction histidine kinase
VILIRTTQSTRDWVELSVVDHGEGMAPEVQAHALEPFYTTKGVGRGTGLGLSMAFGVVTAHGGTLRIASDTNLTTNIE